jgi:prepilin-type N-terminal cleavage/methylation domain-containing protein
MNTATGLRHRVVGRGFTLLELMIVLAILSVLIAVAWPSLRRPVLRSAVQQAARQLVKDLARARMAAIDSGQVMRFRFEPAGSRYEVDPAALSTESDSATRDSTGEDEVPADVSESDQPVAFGFAAQLSDDVVFRDPSAVDEDQLPPGSALARMLQDERAETEEVKPLIDREEQDKALSSPVFFYPTGRAENAEFVLQGPDGLRAAVRLRGLTGAAALGPWEHAPREGANGQNSCERPGGPASPRDLVEPDVAGK